MYAEKLQAEVWTRERVLRHDMGGRASVAPLSVSRSQLNLAVFRNYRDAMF